MLEILRQKFLGLHKHSCATSYTLMKQLFAFFFHANLVLTEI